MGKFLVAALLLMLLVPVDGNADPPIEHEADVTQIVDESAVEEGEASCECECVRRKEIKRPVLRAVRAIKIRKFVGKLIGVQRNDP